MKIAIIHNALDTIGGAEKVTLFLAKKLNAQIYTTSIDKKKIQAMGYDTKNIISIGTIPTNQPYKHTKAFYNFSKITLKKYDKIIICGDWAISAAKHNKCIWYCHAPAREIFDLYKYTKENNLIFWQKPLFAMWAKYHQKKITKYAKNCEKILCNSHNTKQRIKKYMKLDAKVIHPGINTKKYAYKKPKNYWLSVNRLINHKQIEIQLDIFMNLPNEKLVIVGCKEDATHFKKYYKKLNFPKNVKLLAALSEKELIKLYSECKGFITTAKNEDFGLTPIEAMASGKGVIAFNNGGYKETIIHNKTGFLVKNKQGIVKAMKKINKIKKEDCQKQAKKFDNKTFLHNLIKSI